MTLPDSSSLSSADKDTLIATLLSRLAALEAEVVALRAEKREIASRERQAAGETGPTAQDAR